MITIVYRVLIVLAAALVVWELFSQKDIKMQANAALVLIPLLLRAMMIV